MLRQLRHALLGIAPREGTFARRGYADCRPEVRARLEKVIGAFIAGYNTTIELRDPERVATRLEREFDDHHVGFAFEGAGMYYGLLDLLLPWGPSRLRAFTAGVAAKHDYIATVGAGLAAARVPWGVAVLDRYLRRLDPMIAWCVADGYGFHQGLFHPDRFVTGCAEAPAALHGVARQLFDSGVGRSLWWVEGADPARIRTAIERFETSRRAEMWCGIGLACSYAGGVDDDTLVELRDLAGDHRADFLSGVPFATRMRQKGGNPSAQTERACRLLLGMPSERASALLAETVDEMVADSKWTEEQRRAGYPRVRRGLKSRVGERRPALEPVAV